MHRSVDIITVGIILSASFSSARQIQVGRWKSYTDMKPVRSVALSPSGVVAATGGGMFRYSKSAASYTRWTNAENLSTNDLTALMIDKNNRIWVGSSNGAVDVLDGATGTWTSIQDIANSNRPQRAIRSFFSKGDSIFIASDFGVFPFIVSRWEFGDTYADFGFAIQPSVSEVVVNGTTIYVGTDQGMAGASLNSPNLSDRASWTIYAAAQGLSSTKVTSMSVFRDTLLVGTPGGIFSFNGVAFQQVPSTAGKSIAGIFCTENACTYAWNSSPGFTVESKTQVGGPISVVANFGTGQATALTFDPVLSTVYVGTSDRGVVEWDGSQWAQRAPNGPQANAFINLCVDGNGVLWAGSGIGGGGKGFYRFNPLLADSIQWKNFTVAQYPALGSNDYYKASIGTDGSVWMSSWGDGVVQIVADTIRRKLNTTSKPSFAATIAPAYVVIGGVASDPDGATWFVNRTAINGNVLAKLVNDSTFQYFRNSYNPGDGFLSSMVVDQNGTRWMANSEPTQKVSNGLYYFNDNLSVSGTTPYSGWGNMSVSDGLTNSTVLSLAVDQDNNVWVGTDLGVTIITNAQDPKEFYMSSFPLREQSIQTIAVDALNDKWIGTKQGVFVVNPDGTQLLNQHTVLNTGGKLVDDDVRAIAVDHHRGIVYIGTQKGLSVLQIAAVQALRSYTTIQVAPNPYTLPNTQPLTITNLVSNSTIKVLAVNGALMTEFAAQGAGRAFWDGRDSRGTYVPSGVYYIIAFTENGNQVANGKVAVVRK